MSTSSNRPAALPTRSVATMRPSSTAGTHSQTFSKHATPLNNVTNTMMNNNNNKTNTIGSKPMNMTPVLSSNTNPLELDIFSPINHNKHISHTNIIQSSSKSVAANNNNNATANTTNINTLIPPNTTSLSQSHMRTGSMTTAVISPVRDPITNQPANVNTNTIQPATTSMGATAATTTQPIQTPINTTLPISAVSTLNTRALSTPAPLNRPAQSAVVKSATSNNNDNNTIKSTIALTNTRVNATPAPIPSGVRTSFSTDSMSSLMSKPPLSNTTIPNNTNTITTTLTTIPINHVTSAAPAFTTPTTTAPITTAPTTTVIQPTNNITAAPILKTTVSPQRTLPSASASQPTTVDTDTSLIQLQIVKSLISDSIGSLHSNLHGDINNLHLELIRQFHLHEQQTDRVLTGFIQQFQSLVDEVKQLRVENNEFRTMYGMR